jgi:hypothetical protein
MRLEAWQHLVVEWREKRKIRISGDGDWPSDYDPVAGV